MAKKYSFFVDQTTEDDFFSKFIRKKTDYFVTLLKAMRYMKISHLINTPESDKRIVLHVSKNSRLSFVSETKCYSVSFPFQVEEKNNEMIFLSSVYGEVDTVAISNLLNIFKGEQPVCNRSLEELFEVVDSHESLRPGFWNLVREMFFVESGYLRYDHDEENFREHTHPLDHLDIFFSSKATFKLGLNNKIHEEGLLDIIDIETDAYYLSKRT